MKGWTADSVTKLGIRKSGSSSRTQEHDKPKRNNKHEEILQIHIASYMKLMHPNIIFRSDFAAGCHLTMGQAARNKKMQFGRGYPDFFIAKPVGAYSGLFLELKKSRDEVYKKNGSYIKNNHVQEQAFMMQKLIAAGYKCAFACGFFDAVEIIEDYLNS